MRFFFDTEFIEDGKTIDLISIGVVAEDGRSYYAEAAECDRSKASDWVKDNVFPHLWNSPAVLPRARIARELVEFMGEKPEIWAYYADYDWVALCQLYGTMMDLPKGWPMFCRDVKQLCVSLGDPQLPKQRGAEHHALSDAVWTMRAWEFLQAARTPLHEALELAVNMIMACEPGHSCAVSNEAVALAAVSVGYTDDEVMKVIRDALSPAPPA